MQTSQRVLSVKDLTKYIKLKLEGDALLQDVWVRGEISNFTHHSSGHMYFTLKDDGGRVKCVMFASHNQRLAFIPKEGTRVIARGNVSVYDRDGQYQYYVTMMQPDGIGSLFLAFEQLKKKLEQEGLFDERRKRPIPRYPQTVGLITSPTGAAVRDMVTTLRRRYPAVRIVLYPALVQGKQAAASIAAAIEQMNRHGEADVLIVGRGGGSLEELWPFNEEAVARSIRASAIPIISAVGHETDFTIADFAADLRAATPTAAAELAVPHRIELQQQLDAYRRRLLIAARGRTERGRERLARLRRSPYLLQPRRQLVQPVQRLDRLQEQLRYHMQSKLRSATAALHAAGRVLHGHNPRERARQAALTVERSRLALVRVARRIVRDKRLLLHSRIAELDALSPLKVMQRGYGLVYDEQGSLVKSVRELAPGDSVAVRLGDGRANCVVQQLVEEE